MREGCAGIRSIVLFLDTRDDMLKRVDVSVGDHMGVGETFCLKLKNARVRLTSASHLKVAWPCTRMGII